MAVYKIVLAGTPATFPLDCAKPKKTKQIMTSKKFKIKMIFTVVGFFIVVSFLEFMIKCLS